MTSLAALFVHVQPLPGNTLWFALPVGLGVAVVYKTIRTRSLRRLPLEIGILCGYVLAGMIALMLAFWLLVDFVISRN